MKKLLVVAAILLLALTSVFAYRSYVVFDLGYQFKFGNLAHKDANPAKVLAEKFKDHQFAFNLGYEGEFKNGIAIYDRAIIGLSNGLSIQQTGQTFKDKAHVGNFEIAGAVGAGYAFYPTPKLRLMIAAGPRIEGVLYTEEYKGDDLPAVIENFGLEINANAKLVLTRHLALNFSITPSFNIVNVNVSAFNSDDYTASVQDAGAAFGMSVMAGAGVSLVF